MTLSSTLQRAVAAHQAGNLAEAERLYKAVLATDKNQFDALHMLGIIEGQRGNYSEALRRISKALRIQPNSAEAHANLGRIHGALQDYPRAAADYQKALALNPRFALAHNNFSIVLRRLGRDEEALVHCDKAIEIEPRYSDAWNNRGNVLFDLRRFAEAIESYDRALALNSALAESYLGRANVLKEFTRPEEALAAYDKALAIDPNLAEAWFGRGTVLNTFRRFDAAFAAFDKAFAINPEMTLVEGDRLVAKMQTCNWQNLDADRSHLASRINKGALAATPFCLLLTSASPAEQLKCAKRFVAGKNPPIALPIWRGEIYRHDRIRIAYLSADFCNHPVAHLLAGVIERHDRSWFETIAVSFGPDDASAMRTRLKASFERFIDVDGQSDADVARLLRELEVDIAIDLMGHTRNSRLGIFAWRPAPVQVSFLGFAATTGAGYIDYILADQFVIPDDARQFYSEKPAWLPDSFMPTDSGRAIASHTPTRAEQGLPETGFVFCSFNQSYKITPAVFAIWIRLLQQVSGSVLWLTGANDTAVNNLRREAAARGVAPDRLVFASRVEKNDDHLARQRLADLFLDTQPYNAHASACDALWAGLPVLTCAGTTFAGRVAGSLLTALALPELVTHTVDEYEAMALKLARDPALLVSIRDRLMRHRATHPLFNTERFTRHVEAAYRTMWERYQKGEAPQAFAVSVIETIVKDRPGEGRNGDSRAVPQE